MMAHRLLDALRSPAKYPNFMALPHTDLKGIASLIEQAEKFDFGALEFEPFIDLTKPPHLQQQWHLPTLTDEEEQFMDEGLVPLPAPLCWYEFTLGGHVSGLLIKADGWCVSRIDYDPPLRSGLIEGTWIQKEGDDLKMTGHPQALDVYRNNPEALSNMSHGATWGLTRYMTLMLNSKSTEIETIQGHRAAAGKTLRKLHPLPQHRIVRIVPRRYKAAAEAESGRNSPRLHWRRSHVRTYADGRKIVIPRFLVGKADLGTVSHEYRIQITSKA